MADRPIIGILTVSDRASSGEYEDLSGPAIEEVLREYIATDCEYRRALVSDEVPLIVEVGCRCSVWAQPSGMMFTQQSVMSSERPSMSKSSERANERMCRRNRSFSSANVEDERCNWFSEAYDVYPPG